MKIKLKISLILITLCLSATVRAYDSTQEVFKHINGKNWQQAESIAKDSGNKLLLKIVSSQKFLDKEAGSNNFAVVISFINANPNWAEISKLKKRAEKYLNYDTDPKIIVEWFSKNPPQTEDGHKFYAFASTKLNKNPNKEIIRNGWIYGEFSKAEEQKYYAEFKPYFTEEDHIKKIEELLWKGSIVRAQQLLPLVSTNYQKSFTAEMVAIENKPTADQLFSKIPDQYYTSGLLFHYLKFKKKEEPDTKIIKLFDKVKTNYPHKHDWWRLQAYYARELIDRKRFTEAYKVASKILATSARDLSDQQFLLGWLALRFIKKPDWALAHFNKFNDIVKQPISVARGKYWLARTLEVKGDHQKAKKLYQEASSYGYTFYGQLSSVELKNDKIHLPPKPTVTSESQHLLKNNELIQAVKLLVDYDMPALAKTYAKAAIEQASTPAQILLITEQMRRLKNPYYSVEIAKIASQNHTFILDYSFPTPYNITSSPIETALAYGVIRHESVFDQYVIGGVNERGLMQLRENTACITAKSIGVQCSLEKLTRDPYYNIKLGTHHLKDLLEKHTGSYILSIAAYNAGSHRVVKWIEAFGDPRKMKNIRQVIDWMELIPFYGTRDYVQRVLENAQIYRAILNKSNKLHLKQDLLRG